MRQSLAHGVFFSLGLSLLAACGAELTAASKAVASQDGNQAADANTDVQDPTKGTATLSGAVQGHTFVPRSAVFAPLELGSTSKALLIGLSSQASFCEDVGRAQQRQGQSTALAVLTAIDANARTTAAVEGNYTISLSQAITAPSQRAAGFVYINDGNCKSALSTSHATASTGTVHLSAVSDTQVQGTYTFVLGSSTLTGAFDAVACPALSTAFTASGQPSCIAP